MLRERSLEARIEGMEQRIKTLETAARLPFSSIGSGGLVVTDGGAITVEDVDGDPQVVLDSDGLDVGSGLVVVDETGLQVGDDVVVNADGLQVIGGMVTPQWIADEEDFVQNTSLTTTPTVKCSVTFDPPSWVETLFLSISVFGQMTNTSGGNQGFNGQLAGESQAPSGWSTIIPNNIADGMSRTVHRIATSFPHTVQLEAFTGSGTNSSNRLSLAVRAVGVRDP